MEVSVLEDARGIPGGNEAVDAQGVDIPGVKEGEWQEEMKQWKHKEWIWIFLESRKEKGRRK